VEEGVDLELLFPIWLIQDEVGWEEAEIGEFIALWAVPSPGELKHKPTQPAPRMQYRDPLPCLPIIRLSSKRHLEISGNLV